MERSNGFIQSDIGNLVEFSRGSQHIEVPHFILGNSPSEYAARVNELEERLRTGYIEKSPMVTGPKNVKRVYVKKVENGTLYYVEFSGEPPEGGYVFRQEVADIYASKIGLHDGIKRALMGGRIIPFRNRQYTNFRSTMVFLVDEINALRK